MNARKNCLFSVRHALYIVALIVLSTGAAAPNRLLAGVVAVDWYKLGEADPGAVAGNTGNATTIDSVGMTNNLSRAGSPTYSADTAALSLGSTLSMQFNGSTEGYYSSTADSPGLTTNVGIEAWVEAANTTNPFAIIAYNGGANGYGFFQEYGNLYWLEQGRADGVMTAITAGQWVHLGMVFDSLGHMTAYVNGVAVATDSAGTLAPSPGFDIGAGGTFASPAAVFDGNVDQVRVFTFSGAFNPSDFLIGTVPEPSTFVLLGLGAAGMVVAARRRRSGRGRKVSGL